MQIVCPNVSPAYRCLQIVKGDAEQIKSCAKSINIIVSMFGNCYKKPISCQRPEDTADTANSSMILFHCSRRSQTPPFSFSFCLCFGKGYANSSRIRSKTTIWNLIECLRFSKMELPSRYARSGVGVFQSFRAYAQAHRAVFVILQSVCICIFVCACLHVYVYTYFYCARTLQ